MIHYSVSCRFHACKYICYQCHVGFTCTKTHTIIKVLFLCMYVYNNTIHYQDQFSRFLFVVVVVVTCVMTRLIISARCFFPTCMTMPCLCMDMTHYQCHVCFHICMTMSSILNAKVGLQACTTVCGYV